MEEWKVIDGTRGRYKISSRGRVSKDGRICNVGMGKSGYLQVSIGFIFGRRAIHIHRLVASYFLNIPDNYDCLQINHIDGDKTNNSPQNLEWCTAYANQEHRRNILGKHCKGDKNPMYGVRGEKSPVFKGYILKIAPNGDVVGRYAGSGEAAKSVLGTPNNIIRVLGKNRTYHGFLWTREQ